MTTRDKISQQNNLDLLKHNSKSNDTKTMTSSPCHDEISQISSKVEIARIFGVTVPDEYICPITLEVMEHPMLTRYGFHFERSAIIGWLQQSGRLNNTCPLTRKPLSLRDIVSDNALRKKIHFWMWENYIPETKRTKCEVDDDEMPIIDNCFEIANTNRTKRNIHNRQLETVTRRRQRDITREPNNEQRHVHRWRRN